MGARVAATTASGAPIARERLLDRLAGGRLALIEAGSGYGKSTLAAQHRRQLGIATAYVALGPPDATPQVLAGAVRRALLAARLSDLLAATEITSATQWLERLLDALSARADPVLVILDDAHHLASPESAALVLRLARGLPEPHRLLVAARSFVRALQPLWTLPEAVRLTTDDLAFTVAEAGALLRDAPGGVLSAHDVRVAHEATRGWATALVLAARAPAASDAGSDPDPVAGPMRTIFDAMTPTQRQIAGQLAHLPACSPDLADALAGRSDAFEDLIAAGVPFSRTATGWWEMPGPVAAWLAAHVPASARANELAAAVYERHGADLLGLRALSAAGEPRRVAAWLADLDVVRAERLGLGAIGDLLATLPDDAVEAHPRALLHHARLAEAAHRADLRAAALARAAVHAGEDDVLRHELDAERARDLMWDTRTRQQAAVLAGEVVARAADTETVALARALDVLGRLDAWFSDAGPRPQATARLLRSAALARSLGQRTWTAQALVALASGYHFARCEYARGLVVLDEALAELPARNRYRAMVQAFRAEILIEVGRGEQARAALSEMREIGDSCREPWVHAYAAWQAAELASYEGDAVATLAAYRTAIAHRADWYEQPSGVELEVQCADYLSRVGETALAAQCLERARERREATAHLVAVHEAAVLARDGDPDVAEAAIAAVLADPATEPQERWPLVLLRAHVARRAGDRAGATRRAREAIALARELGHPDGPLIRERAIAQPLLALAREPPAGVGAVQITLLGGFSVRHLGTVVTPAAGRPARAVAIVAAGGGRIHAEALTELLWPDAPPAVGRNRLRNLLSRVRAGPGEILRREGAMIALVEGAETDAAELARGADAACRAARDGDHRRAAVIARAALDRIGGELLPDEPYAEWTIAPRQRARAHELDLLGLLIAGAERQGEVDEAIRLARRARELDPDDTARARTLAALLRSQGRESAAAAILDGI